LEKQHWHTTSPDAGTRIAVKPLSTNADSSICRTVEFVSMRTGICDGSSENPSLINQESNDEIQVISDTVGQRKSWTPNVTARFMSFWQKMPITQSTTSETTDVTFCHSLKL
jgi:hypothetical protein